MKIHRRFFAEPRVPDAPARVWRDWVVFGGIIGGSLVEAVFRHDVAWPVPTLVISAVAAATVLWRRTHPLVALAAAFGVIHLFSVFVAVVDGGMAGYYSMAGVLVLPYALFRWGSGREAAMGIPIIIGGWLIAILANPGTLGDAIGGAVVLFVAAEMGAMLRYKTDSRRREIDEVKLLEREQIARELHDIVAHHVSAIVVQAQAGRAVAASRPEAAVDTLQVIEEAAARALEEMRVMVGALREGGEAELAPQQGLADIERLAGSDPGSPEVRVAMSGDLGVVRGSVSAALFRLTQESITNARRHARGATHIDVVVAGTRDDITLTVLDDGGPVPHRDAGEGYGLLGMAERTEMLGGTFDAGPRPGRGWSVTATMPKDGARS